jgi:membrane-associated protease RseP (regulator of RpoE activity)
LQEINTDFEVLHVKEDTSWMRRLELTPWIITRHTLLFVATFASVSFSYLQFAIRIEDGVIFAACFLLFLGTHEFGHYFAAVWHRVRASLPWFIPMPLISIGTLGAVIRIKDPIDDTRRLFDIGIAGPAAGFVVSIILLIVGFLILPGPEHVFDYPGHEALKAYVMQYGAFPEVPPVEPSGETLYLGGTLLFSAVASFFDHVPPLYELYHYPVLFAGWLGLFFTALNLMPFGQLDGGHILYALVGQRKHRAIAYGLYSLLSGLGGVGAVALIQYGIGGFDSQMQTVPWVIWAVALHLLFRFAMRQLPKWITPLWVMSLVVTAGIFYNLDSPEHALNYGMWLFWLFFIVFLVRLDHPPAAVEYQLGPGRRIFGWMSLAVFVLCISPLPFYFL